MRLRLVKSDYGGYLRGGVCWHHSLAARTKLRSKMGSWCRHRRLAGSVHLTGSPASAPSIPPAPLSTQRVGLSVAWLVLAGLQLGRHSFQVEKTGAMPGSG